MKSTRILLLLFCAIAYAKAPVAPIRHGSNAVTEPPADKRPVELSKEAMDQLNTKVAKLVRDLDSDEFGPRAEAYENLKKLGPYILLTPAFKNGQISPSAEVQGRTKSLYDFFAPSLNPFELIASVSDDVANSSTFVSSSKALSKIISGLTREELERFKELAAQNSKQLDVKTFPQIARLLETSMRRNKDFVVEPKTMDDGSLSYHLRRGREQFSLVLSSSHVFALRLEPLGPQGEPLKIPVAWERTVERHVNKFGFPYPGDIRKTLSEIPTKKGVDSKMRLELSYNPLWKKMSVGTIADGFNYRSGLWQSVGYGLYGDAGDRMADQMSEESRDPHREIPLR